MAALLRDLTGKDRTSINLYWGAKLISPDTVHGKVKQAEVLIWLKFIGNPKQPTISIYHLVDEEYQVAQFRNSERIISPTFPDLNLTANQIFNGAL